MAAVAAPTVAPTPTVTPDALAASTTAPAVASDLHPALTPPPSEKKAKHDDVASSSELSNLEDDDADDDGEIVPDHYYEGGNIPVFKPTMKQFRSFKTFIGKIDKYGMKSGIVKVVPPKEWRDALPPLDQAVKSIKVKNPITQEFEGTQGTYVQKNMEKQRSYNLPQWRDLSEASNHQPPAKRGERRRNQDRPARTAPRNSSDPVAGTKRGRGRAKPKAAVDQAAKPDDSDLNRARPLTPTSPGLDPAEAASVDTSKTPKKTGKDDQATIDGADEPPSASKGRQPKSVSSRRKYNRREAADVIDEAAFADFDYRIDNAGEYTPERCEELERAYWKSITYNSPMYGADMPGSLFDESTTSWNVAKLENLLDVLGQKIPGVNTAYLYLGMWKSTFAWHLEDVDLYSINYIHFGAPKQWYSISQEDARRFEAAMRDVWPIPAKACSQFLRHKTFLISPSLLQSRYRIRVNRLVHHEGEFVITFPYGYHSGYNLGYNCAESVNFATEAWLDYGRVAKKCNCEADSVWVDVNDIERKLRGEETEYDETEVDEDDEVDDEAEPGANNLPTPPGSVKGKQPAASRKRKREADGGKTLTKVKRIRIRAKPPPREPCALCPNDIASEALLPTDDGSLAHRLCALYTPETFVETIDGTERVRNIANIDKARLELKCFFCRSKRGACFQCSSKKCIRAYHATCAAAAGVLVDMREVPVFDEEGVEYTDVGIDYRCRFHRPKRSKNLDGDSLEEQELIQRTAHALRPGELVQMQYYKGDIFAGVLVENRRSERTVVVDILPRGERVEVEYKWVLALDPADSHLPVPSANAKPLPARTANLRNGLVRPDLGRPEEGEPFGAVDGPHVWSEFHTIDAAELSRNKEQVNVDMFKPNQVWYYIAQGSTDTKAHYTHDPGLHQHNPHSVFLDLVKPVSSTSSGARRTVPPSSRARQSGQAAGTTKIRLHLHDRLTAQLPSGPSATGPQPRLIQARPQPSSSTPAGLAHPDPNAIPPPQRPDEMPLPPHFPDPEHCDEEAWNFIRHSGANWPEQRAMQFLGRGEGQMGPPVATPLGRQADATARQRSQAAMSNSDTISLPSSGARVGVHPSMAQPPTSPTPLSRQAKQGPSRLLAAQPAQGNTQASTAPVGGGQGAASAQARPPYVIPAPANPMLSMAYPEAHQRLYPHVPVHRCVRPHGPYQSPYGRGAGFEPAFLHGLARSDAASANQPAPPASVQPASMAVKPNENLVQQGVSHAPNAAVPSLMVGGGASHVTGSGNATRLPTSTSTATGSTKSPNGAT